jgi:DNA invertase Pin-like site-specific DNA recombinase
MASPNPGLAAQYLRMSTENQAYSLEYQAEHIAAYAAKHGLTICRTYTDAGVSGLTLKRRSGLKALLADVIAGTAEFGSILVFDVSRWGRFQDLDQGGHYEFLCREAGVQVVYTAEPFRNDGAIGSTIVKHVKRAMAAEFSRDLSAKVALAMRGLNHRGFWTSGPPGYGLRRAAANDQKQVRFIMQSGEIKALRGVRTILVHGPPDEVRTVRRIYSLFVTGGMRVSAIVALLRAEGSSAEAGAAWTANRVRQVLTNDKYAGALLRNKSKGALGRRSARPRSEWVRVPGVLEPIVSRSLFDMAQKQFQRRKSNSPSDAELLAELRIVYRDHGRVSTGLINAHPDTHCASVIIKRFGSLITALELVEIEPTRRQRAAAAVVRAARPYRFRTHRTYEPAEVLDQLKRHFAERGYISCASIEDDRTLPPVCWLARHVGDMSVIYGLVGHEPTPRQRNHLAAAAWRQRLKAEAQALRTRSQPPS